MACESEWTDLQNAILARGATALTLLQANSAKVVADSNYATALANDNAAAALVESRRTAYLACVMALQPEPPPDLPLMPSAPRKRKPAAKKKKAGKS